MGPDFFWNLRHAKRAAVQGSQPKSFYFSKMLRSPVTLVLMKTELGILLRNFHHKAIPTDLGQDRGCRDRLTLLVPLDDRLLWNLA